MPASCGDASIIHGTSVGVAARRGGDTFAQVLPASRVTQTRPFDVAAHSRFTSSGDAASPTIVPLARLAGVSPWRVARSGLIRFHVTRSFDA